MEFYYSPSQDSKRIKSKNRIKIKREKELKMLEIGIMNKNNISKLSEILEKEKSVEFKYNNLFYEIFENCDIYS